jgi:hypothetical protein
MRASALPDIVPAPLCSRRWLSSTTRRWNLTLRTMGAGSLMCGVVTMTSYSRRWATTFFFFCNVRL